MAEDRKGKGTQADFVDKLWGFFTSLKLVIVLLLVLAVLSVAGTLIEQNKPLQEYYSVFQPGTVALFSKLGLFDMYHSWWFTSCLGLLALNIIACTMERFPAIVRGMTQRAVLLDEKTAPGLMNLTTLRYGLPAGTVEERVTALAAKSFSSRPVVTEAEGSRHFFYEKGRLTRLAFFLTHLSVLVIFLGAIAGSLFGFKGFVNVGEGETISAVQIGHGESRSLDFGVKCNAFAVDFYPNGAPKDYRSDLSIIREGREVVRKTIRVNDPLSYGGMTFYQASYGSVPEGVVLEVGGKGGTSLGTLSLPFATQVKLPGTETRIELLDYREHFHLNDGTEAGPAFGLNVYRPGAEPVGIWISETRPEMNAYEDYSFRVKDVKLNKYTGLQVNRDPGVWAVWAGSLMLVAGIMMAFFMSHKKLYVRIGTDRKGRVEVTTGGTTNKNKYAFGRELERLVESFREVG